MNNKHLQRTLRLLRRTGDRGIIIDQESDELFVLMDVDAYEDLLGVADEQPQSGPQGNDSELMGDYVLDDLIEVAERAQSTTPSRHVAAPEQTELQALEKVAAPAQKLNFDKDWAVEKPAIVSEESLADVPHDGEEEEKFYLEPVE